MKNITSIIVLSLTSILIGCDSPMPVNSTEAIVQPAVATGENTATLWVNGIGCPGCIPSVKEPMLKLNGVQAVSVELQTGVVTVTLNETNPATQDQLSGAIEDGGFTLTKIEMPQ
ncbi:MAG TPA: copper chaperone [Phycisphaerales bacterium]|nr:copper chaperone [Phycisphaerales bacterium]HIB01167.1 copper chaperone [Phycisphaerales bacterium]HIB50639.1 copper chaperone [Phycisphaerales bacterium]HIO20547.1 copper chaperone [Phycisphaerales bacterium]HIO53121.1 copper chaperone [Phycisphaerales bacterium]